MRAIYFLILNLGVLALATGCLPESAKMEIEDVYAFATPKTFPAAAIFMTVENETGNNDRLIGFETSKSHHIELHTMDMDGDIMKMRRVDGYDIADDEQLVLKPKDNHIMVFDLEEDLVEGKDFKGTAIFEKAGSVPVTVHVRPRADMAKHM